MGDQTITQTTVHIRWMIHRDMPEILAIEQRSFDVAWSDPDIIASTAQ